MRLSSPSLAAAFIDGAREQGADVVDYGMCAHRHALLRASCATASTAARRSPRRTIPKRVQRHQDGPARGVPAVGRRRHRRHPRHGHDGTHSRRRRGRRARVESRDLLDDYVEKVMSFIDPAVIKPFNVVLDAGSGMAGLVAPRLFDRLPCKTTRLCFDDRRHVPEPRGQSAHRREPAGHRRARHRREGGHRHRVGRRRRPLLLHRRHRRVHRRRLRHGAARRGGAAQVAGRRRSSTTCAPATPSRTSSRSTAARR